MILEGTSTFVSPSDYVFYLTFLSYVCVSFPESVLSNISVYFLYGLCKNTFRSFVVCSCFCICYYGSNADFLYFNFCPFSHIVVIQDDILKSSLDILLAWCAYSFTSFILF